MILHAGTSAKVTQHDHPVCSGLHDPTVQGRRVNIVQFMPSDLTRLPAQPLAITRQRKSCR